MRTIKRGKNKNESDEKEDNRGVACVYECLMHTKSLVAKIAVPMSPLDGTL